MVSTDVTAFQLSPAEHQVQLRRAVIASTIGTAIEWYDFFLYSTVTGLVFAKLFFPNSSEHSRCGKLGEAHMNRHLLPVLIAFVLAAEPSLAQSQQPYAGFEGRSIKALSEQQIADLRAGRGMGLALAAELNGYPGPMHVLELADSLDLSGAIPSMSSPSRRSSLPIRLAAMSSTTSIGSPSTCRRRSRTLPSSLPTCSGPTSRSSSSSASVVCILDKHHSDKIWPTFEREIFMPRVVSGTVIPIFLDDTKFVGIPRDVIGIKFKYDPADPDWQKKANDEIIVKLIDKLSEY